MPSFLDRMSSILETPVTPETVFREVDGWSSLMGFSILVTLENDFGRPMMVDEFQAMKTVGDLAVACGLMG